ncbi:MAG: 4Fe-4S ferredoxin, partial [Bacteroidales bacterium]
KKNNLDIDLSKLKKQKSHHTMPQSKETHSHDHPHNHNHSHGHQQGGGCPGSRMMTFAAEPQAGLQAERNQNGHDQPSALRQWPVQLHLVNPQAPYFQNADVLLAADCVAFSMGNFHSKYLKGKGLAIACPKLDTGKDIYVEKLTAMIDNAQINTMTVMTMEVPCCSGLVQMAKMAVQNATRKVPVKKMVVGIDGQIRSEEWI